jgi:hypothetical protein
MSSSLPTLARGKVRRTTVQFLLQLYFLIIQPLYLRNFLPLSLVRLQRWFLLGHFVALALQAPCLVLGLCFRLVLSRQSRDSYVTPAMSIYGVATCRSRLRISVCFPDWRNPASICFLSTIPPVTCTFILLWTGSETFFGFEWEGDYYVYCTQFWLAS